MKRRTVHLDATWCQLAEGAVWLAVVFFCTSLVLLAPPTRLLVTGRAWCQHVARADCDLCLQATRGAWYEGERASVTCGPLDRDCLDRARVQVCR